MKIRILESAMEDLRRGRMFYDAQEEGVGDYFQDSLMSDIDSLVLYGGMHHMVFGYHRMLAKRFPYAIYYKVETPGELVIVRVLDCRRDPKRIKAALE